MHSCMSYHTCLPSLPDSNNSTEKVCMCLCTHIYMHTLTYITCMHTRKKACMHTDTSPIKCFWLYYIHTYIHTHTHKYMHTDISPIKCFWLYYIHTYIHTHTHKYMHTYRHIPYRVLLVMLHTYIHTCIHTDISTIKCTWLLHTYIHTYIHAYIQIYPLSNAPGWVRDISKKPADIVLTNMGAQAVCLCVCMSVCLYVCMYV